MRRGRDSAGGAIASILAISGLAIAIFASLLVSIGPGVSASNQWVTIVNFSFTPADLVIDVGDAVTWQNNATSALHTATSTSAPSGGAFDSGTIAAGGGLFTHTFTVAGYYGYECSFHPSMTGTITVGPVIPEFSSFTFVVVGLITVMLGLVLARRRP